MPRRGRAMLEAHFAGEKVSRPVLDMNFRRSAVAVADEKNGEVKAPSRPFLAGEVQRRGDFLAAIFRLKIGGFPKGRCPARILLPTVGDDNADQLRTMKQAKEAMIAGFGATLSPLLGGVLEQGISNRSGVSVPPWRQHEGTAYIETYSPALKGWAVVAEG